MDDDDESDGNKRKRRKLDANQNTLNLDTSSSIDRKQDQLQNALNSIKDIFASKCYSRLELLEFSKKANRIVTANEKRLKELEYRESVCSTLFKNLKSNGTRAPGRSYLTNWYTNEIVDFAQSMIKECRFMYTKEYEETDYSHCCRYTAYAVDIALKSQAPHELYIKTMDPILRSYVSDIKHLSRLIAEYCDNGYRWYRLRLTEETGVEVGDGSHHRHWTEFRNGLIYNVVYKHDDYFRNNTYYKARKPKCGLPVQFAQWRQVLDHDHMSKMTDAMLVCFIIGVATTLFHFYDEKLEDTEKIVLGWHA